MEWHRIKKGMRKLLYQPNIPFDFLFCKIKIGIYNTSWRLYGYPLIVKKGELFIGRNFIACSSSRHNSIGVFQKVIIKVTNKKAILEIGNNVGISGSSISCSSSIVIGNNVLIGSGTLITDSDAHSIYYSRRNDPSAIKMKPVIIEDDVFIGARSIILKGVTIGRGAVIGAGSVVTGNIPSLTIAAGNPARVVKRIEE